VPLPVGVETVTLSDGGVPVVAPDGTVLNGYLTVTGVDLGIVSEDDLVFGGYAHRPVVDGRFNPLVLIASDATGIVSTNGQTASESRTVSGAVTVRPIDRVLKADASGGAVTVNLPSAAPNPVTYSVIKSDATGNTVTVDPAGSETINGAATRVLSAQWETVTLKSDGTNWIAV
jgi:hypothetical protein